MNLKLFLSSLIIFSLIVVACSERIDTYEIIGTTTTQQKLDNESGTATAVAERAASMEATRAAGGEVDLRPAERAAATAQAEATAAAEAGAGALGSTLAALDAGTNNVFDLLLNNNILLKHII